jgi:O-antigen/teichoic acid export membrane protein
MMLGTLTGNLPRYAVEGSLGITSLGVFAAVASFLTAGSTIVNALGQAATPRLARCFSEGDLRGFRRLIWRLCGLALVLGMAGVVVAMVVGRPVLRLFYGPAYTAHASLLVQVMAAAALNYVAGMLGYVLTSARQFRVQVPLLAATAAVCGGASVLLVRSFGLSGAVLALACAWGVQLSGELWVLRGVLRDRELRA